MDHYASIAEESKPVTLTREFQILAQNLYCGIKLLAFRRNTIEQITVSHDQFVLLLSFYALTAFIVSYLMTPYPVFDLFGLGYLGIELLITLLVGFVLAKLTGKQNSLSQFLTIAYCISPFLYLVSFVALPYLPETFAVAGHTVFTLWTIAACFYIALQLLDHRKLKAALVIILWMGASYPLVNSELRFWYPDYAHADDMAAYSDDELIDINQEDIYYNQPLLLNTALDPIKPGIEGITDLFFVGFGSDAIQDVFMKEINHVQHVMDERFGTSGRSVALINNLKTINTTPLASSKNLKISLDHLGSKMNRDEDVVFLYLTSHGSMDHDLSVRMWSLDLNSIRPEDIKTYLDDAGIRWRIILVSACYSGGFVEPLQNEYSLIFTAAAADKTSFGCANENEYTYFGESIFKNIDATGPYQFVESFNRAISKIKQRELNENLTHSEPQLFVGSLMKEKLKRLEQDMSRYTPVRFSALNPE